MLRILLGLLGHKLVKETVGQKVIGSRFNIKLGIALMRDGRLPWRYRFGAMSIGALTAFLLDLVELPLGAIFAVILPIIGVPIDLALLGIEDMAILPIVTLMALPFLAPKWLVEKVQQERTIGTLSPLTIDVPAA